MSTRQLNRQPNRSITGVQSFRPELEFEIIKTVLLRENYLKRIQKALKDSKGKIDMGLIGMVDTLRECSIEVVDIIQTWERTQVDYPDDVKPFNWNGVNYLTKMSTDYEFFHEYPSVEKWLGFSPMCNPFFIPPEALNANAVKDLQENSFVVFGIRPPAPPEPPRAKPIMPKFVKSPYLTPIHNDLDVFPQNSAVNRAKSKEKLRGAAQAAADALQQVGKDKAKDALTDPYQSFISANAIKQAVKMMEVLVKNNGGNVLYDPTTSLGGDEYSPMSSFIIADEMPSTMPPGPGSPMKTPAAAGGGAGRGTRGLPPVPASGKALGSKLEEGSLEILPTPAPTKSEGSPGSPLRPHRGAMIQSSSGAPGSPTHTIDPAPGSPHKQSIKAAVGTTGQFAGRLGSTSVFSQSREDFESTQDGFRQTMQGTSDDSALDNKAMRMSSLVEKSVAEEAHGQFTSQLDSSFASQSTATTNNSKIWTPHEITLQRAVRRRGGELFVLTAAGTRGHIKAPTRRTRYERLRKDMDGLEKQATIVEESIEKKRAQLDNLNEGLGDVMNQIEIMGQKIVSSIGDLSMITEESTLMIKEGLESVESSINTNNLINTIQTYQMYKLRKGN